MRHILCFVFRHKWRLIATSDRHDRLRHIHPMAGTLARCKRCGWFWDDLPGATRKSTRNR